MLNSIVCCLIGTSCIGGCCYYGCRYCNSSKEQDETINLNSPNEYGATTSNNTQREPDSQYQMGRHYQFGTSIKTEETAIKAAQCYTQSAIQGYSEGQLMLAKCYMNGYGVPINHKEARKWVQAAADNGNELAKRILTVYNSVPGLPAGQVEITLDWEEPQPHITISINTD